MGLEYFYLNCINATQQRDRLPEEDKNVNNLAL